MKCDILFLNLAIAAFQRHSFCKILTQFYPISWVLLAIAFLQAATEIYNKDTSKYAGKIRKSVIQIKFFWQGGKSEDEIPSRILKIIDFYR